MDESMEFDALEAIINKLYARIVQQDERLMKCLPSQKLSSSTNQVQLLAHELSDEIACNLSEFKVVEVAHELFEEMPERVRERLAMESPLTANVMVNRVAGNFLVSPKDLFSYDCRPVSDIHSVGMYTMCHETLQFLQTNLTRVVDAPQMFEELPEQELVPWNATLGTEFEHLEKVKYVPQLVCTHILAFISIISGWKQVLYSDVIPWRPDSLISLVFPDLTSWQAGMCVLWFCLKSGGYLSLLNMHSKCKSLEVVVLAFEELLQKDVISWTAVVGVYARIDLSTECLELYKVMMDSGVHLDGVYINYMLIGFVNSGGIYDGKTIHGVLLKRNFLIDTLRDGAISLIRKMEMDGIDPDEATFVGVVTTLSHSGMITDGLDLFKSMTEVYEVKPVAEHYGCIVDLLIDLFHHSNPWVEASLLDMCVRCFTMEDSQELLGTLVHKERFSVTILDIIFINVYRLFKIGLTAYLISNMTYLVVEGIILWNPMIAGLSRHAWVNEAMILFEKMLQNGMYLNEVMYIFMLSAWSHISSFESGCYYFDQMMKDENVQANVLQYSCMVVVLGRSGRIQDARGLIATMPFTATASIWGSLLGACRIHGDLELAKGAAGHLFALEPENARLPQVTLNETPQSKQEEAMLFSLNALTQTFFSNQQSISYYWIAIAIQLHDLIGRILTRTSSDLGKIGKRSAEFPVDELIEQVEDFAGVFLHEIDLEVKVKLDEWGNQEKGTVAFSVGLHCLTFTFINFAKRYASKFRGNENQMIERFWGENYIDLATKKGITRSTGSHNCKWEGVQFCYEPIKQILNTYMNDQKDKLGPMLHKLGVTMKANEKELLGKA